MIFDLMTCSRGPLRFFVPTPTFPQRASTLPWSIQGSAQNVAELSLQPRIIISWVLIMAFFPLFTIENPSRKSFQSSHKPTYGGRFHPPSTVAMRSVRWPPGWRWEPQSRSSVRRSKTTQVRRSCPCRKWRTIGLRAWSFMWTNLETSSPVSLLRPPLNSSDTAGLQSSL